VSILPRIEFFRVAGGRAAPHWRSPPFSAPDSALAMEAARFVVANATRAGSLPANASPLLLREERRNEWVFVRYVKEDE